MKKRFFQRHPALTIILTILIIYGVCDVLIERIFVENRTQRIYHPYYHHDLKKNYSGMVRWGDSVYPFYTNSLGFRDRERRKIDPQNFGNRRRILLIGDSFVEGMGLSYEKSFPGIVAHNLSGSAYEILNAGVLTYSPRLYYLKIRYLIEAEHLKFNELYVFIDISDIQDEIFYESYDPDTHKETALSKAERFISSNSFTYELMRASILGGSLTGLDGTYNGRSRHKCGNNAYMIWKTPEDYWKEREQWTYNKDCYQKWGIYGLRLAKEQMEKLHRLCVDNAITMTIVVYPYPGQIQKGDLHSIQVDAWREFSGEKSVDFIDLFPCFINESPADENINKYYIKDDCHWNSAGNRLTGEIISGHISGEHRLKDH
jgi:hypothetical protein